MSWTLKGNLRRVCGPGQGEIRLCLKNALSVDTAGTIVEGGCCEIRVVDGLVQETELPTIPGAVWQVQYPDGHWGSTFTVSEGVQSYILSGTIPRGKPALQPSEAETLRARIDSLGQGSDLNPDKVNALIDSELKAQNVVTFWGPENAGTASQDGLALWATAIPEGETEPQTKLYWEDMGSFIGELVGTVKSQLPNQGQPPTITLDGDQISVDGVVTGPHLTGPPGEPGKPGEPGPPGKDGPVGAPGVKLSVGTVTSGSPAAAKVTPTADGSGQVLDLTIPAGAPGAPGSQGPKGDSAVTPSTVEIRGTGSPYGTVTPPAAGTYYTDVAGTAGAWRWIATDSSSNGWRVIYGDTGWRDVSSLLDPKYVTGGQLQLRRVSDLVYVNWNDVTTNGVDGDHFLTTSWPSGFHLAGSFYDAYTLGGGTNNRARFDILDGYNIRAGVPNGGLRLRDLSAKPARSKDGNFWPTALPGNPA